MIMETKKNAEIPNKMIDPETGMVKVKIQDRAQIIQHSLFVSQLSFSIFLQSSKCEHSALLTWHWPKKRNQ